MSNEQQEAIEAFKTLPPEEQLQALCDFIRENLVGNPVVKPDAIIFWLRDYLYGANMFDTERVEEIKELKKRVSELEAKLPPEEKQIEVKVLESKTTEP